jgi:hypothetical protein
VHKHKIEVKQKMPKGDKTGPYGAGPMTGRAAGYCAGYSVPGYMNPRRGYGRGFGRGWGRGFGRGWGRGFGRGWGRGFGRGWGVYPPAYPQVIQQQTPEQEVTALENYQKDLVAEKTDLEKEITDVKTRIEDLKKKLEEK